MAESAKEPVDSGSGEVKGEQELAEPMDDQQRESEPATNSVVSEVCVCVCVCV